LILFDKIERWFSADVAAPNIAHKFIYA
jgi:hypothetical protein